MKEKSQDVRLSRLRRDLATLEGEMATSAVIVQRCDYELGLRQIRAPVSGNLGENADLRVGAFISAGQQLAAIVPPGELRAIARFSPLTGPGRIQPGQRALLRLDGFPWAQYGTVQAVVSRVAKEPRDGHIRVELAVRTNAASAIPLQHGLTGTVEVQVERASPATLILRAAGKLLTRPRDASPSIPARPVARL